MKKSILLLLSFLSFLSIAACSGGGKDPHADTHPKDVVIVTQVEPDVLDPQGTAMQYAFQVMMQFNGYLMEYDKDSKLVPSLAESYEISKDCKTFTFKLRQGVMFHNGEELKASDVVYTMNRGKNHDFSPQHYSLIESCTALSDYEVEFKLVRAYAPFLSITATPGFAILNEKAVEAIGANFARNPVGCGPYKFVSWTPGENIQMEAFEDYFKGAPRIKKATFKFIGDQNTALIGLEAGDVDYTLWYPESAKPDIQASNDMALVYYDSTALQFITLNTSLDYFKNKLVRQAINIAINRDDIISVAVEGEGTPTSYYCNTNTFGYIDLPGYIQDVERAKLLMTEAGYANGFSVKITAQDDMTQKIAQVFASAVGEIGINCEIEVIESNTAIANFMAGEYQIGVLGINNAQLDIDFIKILFEPDAPLNMSKYENQDLFNKFTEASMISNQNKRLEAYSAINGILFDEAIYVPLFFPNRAHAMNSGLAIDFIGGSGIPMVYNMYWK